jgi:cysteine desulfurase/selenocysteine lyase
MLGCREGFAQLIGAKPAEIAITKNVSEGINIVANAVDWRPGDNAVVCPELEHPNNVFIWLALQRRGVEVRKVPAANLDIDVAAMARAIDGRTRIVTASSVTFTPGYRSDIAALGAECRKRDVFFLVDAVQSAGVLGLDVAAEAIDGLAVSSSKGLLGVIGLGFLYVREAWIPRLTPAYVARFSVDLGGAHESEGAWVDEIRFMPDARRFEIGNYNWAAMAAMEASLKRLNAVGVDVIESQAVRLAEKLRDGLAARGYPVSRGPKGRRPSHIVTSGRLGTGGAYSTADERLNRFA